MQSLVLFILYGAQLAAAATTSCNRDNCLRAVLASTRPASADCASYLRTTVTPVVTITATSTASASAIATTSATSTPLVTVTTSATTTITVTGTTTVTETDDVPVPTPPGDDNFIKARSTTSPASKSIPAYASPCSGAVRYSSACSCIGVKPATVTASPSTTTITRHTSTATITDSTYTATVTVATSTVTITAPTSTSTISASPSTETVTTTSTCSGPSPTFYLQIEDTTTDANGNNYNGYYAQLQTASDPDTSNLVAGTTSLSEASLFTLDQFGFIYSNSEEGYAIYDSTSSAVTFIPPSLASNYPNYSPFYCIITPTGGGGLDSGCPLQILTCSTGYAANFESCSGVIYIVSTLDSGCTSVTFSVVSPS